MTEVFRADFSDPDNRLSRGFEENYRGKPYLLVNVRLPNSPFSLPVSQTLDHLACQFEGHNEVFTPAWTSSSAPEGFPDYPDFVDGWPATHNLRFYNDALDGASWSKGTFTSHPALAFTGALPAALGFPLEGPADDANCVAGEVWQSRCLLSPMLGGQRGVLYLTPGVEYFITMQLAFPSGRVDLTGNVNQFNILWQLHNNSAIVTGSPDWTLRRTNKGRQIAIAMGKSLTASTYDFILPIDTTNNYIEADRCINFGMHYKPDLTDGIFKIYHSMDADALQEIWDFADEGDGGGLWVANRTLPVNGIDSNGKTQYSTIGNYFDGYGDAGRWPSDVPVTQEVIYGHYRIGTTTDEAITDADNSPWAFLSSDTTPPTLNASSAPSQSAGSETSITWTWNAATDDTGVDHYVPYIHGPNTVPDPAFAGSKGDPVTGWKETLDESDWAFSGGVATHTPSGAEDRLWSTCLTIGVLTCIKFHVAISAGTLKLASGTTDLFTFTALDDDTDVEVYVAPTATNLTFVADATFAGAVSAHTDETGITARELTAQANQGSASFVYTTTQGKTEIMSYVAVDAAGNVSDMSLSGEGTASAAAGASIIAADIAKSGAYGTPIVFDVVAQATPTNTTGTILVDTLNQPASGGTVAKSDGDTTITFTPDGTVLGAGIPATYDLIDSGGTSVESNLATLTATVQPLVSYLSLNPIATPVEATTEQVTKFTVSANQTAGLPVTWSLDHDTLAGASIQSTGDLTALVTIEPQPGDVATHTITVRGTDGTNSVSQDVDVEVVPYIPHLDVVPIVDNAANTYYFQLPKYTGFTYSLHPESPALTDGSVTVNPTTGLMTLVTTADTGPWYPRWYASDGESVEYGDVIFAYAQHVADLAVSTKRVGVIA